MKANTFAKPLSRTPRGFTLVELLVVITIIVVLAAVGFPTMARMKASSNNSKCMVRLRTWGIAMGGYAADHDGRIEWRNWYPISWARNPVTGKEQMSPYVHYWTGGTVDVDNRSDAGAFQNQLEMRYCPSVTWDKKGNEPVCYAMSRPTENGGVVASTNGTEYPLSKILSPSRFIIMIDQIAGNLNPMTSSGDFTSRVKPLTVQGELRRHDGKVNSLMGDFSVRTMTWKEIEKGLTYWTAF